MSHVAIEDVYPLSPAQRGLLAQCLLDPHSGYFVVQFIADLIGPLDLSAFQKAWKNIQVRHVCLRSSFIWEKVEEPLQIVHQKAELEFAVVEVNTTEERDQFLAYQRDQGFNLKKASLFTITILQTGEGVHQLLWSYHHLIMDGWSSALLLKEVFAEYHSILEGQPCQFITSAPYSRYVKWLSQVDQSAAEDFWKKHLLGYCPVRSQASRQARPIPQSAELNLKHELWEDLRDTLRSCHVTISTFVHAVWGLLLIRRIGISEIVLGSVVSGRPESLAGAAEIIGPLINTLPLRICLDLDCSVVNWLQQLQQSLMTIQKFGTLSLAKIASLADVPTDQPLFDSILTVENYPDSIWNTQNAGALRIGSVQFIESTGYPLCLEAIPTDSLMLRVLFDEARFSKVDVNQLLAEAQEVIRDFVNAPDQHLQSWVRRSESACTVSSSEETIISRWDHSVKNHAHRIAVSMGDQQITYQELDHQSEWVATALTSIGVKSEQSVLLMLDRSIPMIASILGVLKSGAVYVPVEPIVPDGRFEEILNDARITVAIIEKKNKERFRHFNVQLIVIEDLDEQATVQRNMIHLDQAAYVIYTSGSTGKPKGVVVSHRNVVRLFEVTQHLGFTHNDAWTLFHSYAFDFSVWEIWGALLNGGRLEIVPYSVSRSPEDFAKLLNDRRITVLNQTPSAFRLLASINAQLPDSLRYVIFGGEALAFDTLTSWFRQSSKNVQFINMYGITETTVHTTIRPMNGIDAELVTGSLIGIPLNDLSIHLLKDSDTVAVGESGEICVGGSGVTRGYLNDPGLTADRFIPDPFHYGGRLYRSGDAARCLPSGEFEYLGRLDRQIKIRGFRIEPGEIEAILRKHPAIEDAVVVANSSEGETTLTAYVVPSLDIAGPIRHLLNPEVRPVGVELLEVSEDLAVLQKNRSETQFMYDEIIRSSCYLRGGITLQEGDCVFDVGANIGLFSVAAAIAQPGITVYAFEPMPEICSILDVNFSAHQLAGKVFNVAVGAAESEAGFDYYPFASVLSGRRFDKESQRVLVEQYLAQKEISGGDEIVAQLLSDRLERHTVIAQITTISKIIHDYNVSKIDLLKIDVEGSEIDVLSGIEEQDWDRIGQFAIEVHGTDTLDQIREQLSARGFQIEIERQSELEQTSLWMLYAVRGKRTFKTSVQRTLWRSPSALTAEIRRYLERSLPDYMSPRTVRYVSKFPLTLNGKVDIAALRKLDSSPASARLTVQAETAAEKTLAMIWQELFGFSCTDIHRSFFELGGDSILCIQMVTRARRAGLHFSPGQVFELKTIAALAKIATASNNQSVGTHATGEIPLTTIQQWFFSLNVPNRHHWNQAILLELSEPLSRAQLEPALKKIVLQYDAFQLRFRNDGKKWHAAFSNADQSVGLIESSIDDEIASINNAHHSLNIEQGPLLQVVLIGEKRLALVAHHLVIDALSWRIVLEDLFQTLSNESAPLPFPSTSLADWARQSTSIFSSKTTQLLPRDLGGESLEATTKLIEVSLSSTDTDALIKQGNDVTEICVAACVHALSRWLNQTDIEIDVESHGRNSRTMDLSRTVGWFTKFETLSISIPEVSDPAQLLRSVRRAREQAQHGPSSEFCLNYLGRIDAGNSDRPFRLLKETVGELHDPSAIRPHLLSIETMILDGKLMLKWMYSDAVHLRETIDSLARNTLQVLKAIAMSSRYRDDALSIIRFPWANITSTELNSIVSQYPDLEDIYHLTPAQEGILFHLLFDPTSTAYVSQFYWTFRGSFDVDAYRYAWQIAAQRHPLLRTSFIHTGLQTPHQVVHQKTEVPVDFDDARGEENVQQFWDSHLLRYRQRPFDPVKAPLTNLAVVRVREEEYRLIWNHHHLMIDGWCTGIILRDVFMAYEALIRKQSPSEILLPAPRPFRDYVAWLSRQPLEEAEQYWKKMLQDWTSLPSISGTPQTGSATTIFTLMLDPELDENLGNISRQIEVTLNVLVMAAWARVLSNQLNRDEVIFGSTVAGRPVDLDGSDEIVGLFINTLPVRIRMPQSTSFRQWLQEIQVSYTETRKYEFSALSQIRRWSGLPLDQTLFETAVVFENLPAQSLMKQAPTGLEVTDTGSFVQNHFPFTVRVVPGSPMQLDGLFDPTIYSEKDASRLLKLLQGKLAHMVEVLRKEAK